VGSFCRVWGGARRWLLDRQVVVVAIEAVRVR